MCIAQAELLPVRLEAAWTAWSPGAADPLRREGQRELSLLLVPRSPTTAMPSLQELSSKLSIQESAVEGRGDPATVRALADTTRLTEIVVLLDGSDSMMHWSQLTAALSEISLTLSRGLGPANLTLVVYGRSVVAYPRRPLSYWHTDFPNIEAIGGPPSAAAEALHQVVTHLNEAPASARKIALFVTDGQQATDLRQKAWQAEVRRIADSGAALHILGYSSVGWRFEAQRGAEEALKRLTHPIGLYQRIKIDPRPRFDGALTFVRQTLEQAVIVTYILQAPQALANEITIWYRGRLLSAGVQVQGPEIDKGQQRLTRGLALVAGLLGIATIVQMLRVARVAQRLARRRIR